MSNRFIDVRITRESRPVNVVGFGNVLILGTSKTNDYKEYQTILDVEKDYATDTKEYKLAERMFKGDVDQYGRIKSPTKIAIVSTLWNDATGEVTALTDVLEANREGWFYLVTTTKDAEAVEALAQWTTENKKVFGTTTTDKNLLTTLAGFKYTYVQVSKDENSLAAEGVIALASVTDPGNITFTYKTLQNISPSKFTNAEIDEIHRLNGNTYIKEGGVDVTSSSKMMNGNYLDELLGEAFIESEMTKNAFEILTKNGKIPYDDRGIALAVGAVDKTLKTAANMGIIEKDASGNGLYEITAPRLQDIKKADKASRILKGVEWRATQEGAIEGMELSGLFTW